MTMSIPAQTQPDKLNKTPLNNIHRRNNSDELDVFEAADYFSGSYNEEANSFHNTQYYHQQKLMRRTSFDSPIIRNPTTTTLDQQKHKQKPTSSGSKIATFFNSIFNQSKKTKSITKTQSFEEEGVGKRKRRSSMGYFRSSTRITTDHESKSSSGFRTPPVSSYAVYTPTKSVISDDKHIVSLLQNVKNYNDINRPIKNGNLYLLDEELKLHDHGEIKLDRNSWVDCQRATKENIDYFNEDDGAESDSDLFELKNYDLGIYSTALPVC